jgi:iron complex outermembrane receptor protein
MATFNKNPLIPIALAGLVSQGAHAQVLEETLVTAQKRAESLQDVPLSVSALTAGELKQLRLQDTTQIAAQIPNVQITTAYSESQPSFSIRGVSMTDWSMNQSSPVAMYVNGVYKSVGALQSLQLYDMDRIEILRGPQGTLYGKNATGGAVNIITTKPEIDGVTRGYIAAGAGNYSLFESDAAVEVSSPDSGFGARAAFTYSTSDGWVDNNLPGRDDNSNHDDYAGRLSLRYQPTDELDIVLMASGSKRETDAGYEVLAGQIGPGGVGFFTEYDRSGLDYFEGEMERADQSMEVDNSGASLGITWDLSPDYTLDSLTSYDTGDWDIYEDADGSPYSIAHADYLSSVDSFSQELRLTSNLDGWFNFILGAYAHFEDLDANVDLMFYHSFAGDSDGNGQLDCLDDFFTGCTYSNELEQEKESYALFFQGNWELTDRLELTAGIRYNSDDVEITKYNAWIGYFDPETQSDVDRAIPTIVDYQDDTNDSDVTYRLALDYAVSEDVSVYGSFSTGFRNSAYNGQAFLDASEITVADPEEVDAWEIGIKSDLAGGRLRINGAVFYYDYTNQQFLDVTPEFLQILVNADEASVAGAEIELSALPTPNFEIRAGLGYLDTEYEELELQGQDLSGNELQNAPKVNFNALFNWTFAQSSVGDFYLGADAVYVDDQYFTAFNDDDVSQEAYWISNARLGYRGTDGSLQVAAWVKNISEEEYVTAGVDLRGSFNYVYNHRGRPRTYGVEFTYNF